jgi:hypothetical protein
MLIGYRAHCTAQGGVLNLLLPSPSQPRFSPYTQLSWLRPEGKGKQRKTTQRYGIDIVVCNYDGKPAA